MVMKAVEDIHWIDHFLKEAFRNICNNDSMKSLVGNKN